MPKKEAGQLMFWQVTVTIDVLGPLHATSPQNPEGVGYMLAHQPTEAELEARRAAGEAIIPLSELEEEVSQAVAAEAAAPQRSVFRRLEDGRPYIHHNFFKGHLRDSAEGITRAVNFWGLHQFVTRTLFVRPDKTFLPEGCPIEVEKWPTHFDLYRKGRVSSFREAEWVDSPRLSFRVALVNDPRWTRKLLEELFQFGSLHGLGGGRGRGMGQYRYELGEMVLVPRSEV